MTSTYSEINSIASCRHHFPALQREFNGRPLVYFDGPGGSQVPLAVIEAIDNYYRLSNANSHGKFVTSEETDLVIANARNHMAAMLGADPGEISFGQNMTSLNFSLSKALARSFDKNAKILITQLDHEANRGPWLTLEEQGFKVVEIAMKPNGTLDYHDLSSKLTDDTALVAVGYASNAIGTVNNLQLVRELCNKAGALMLVDAVHYAPHFSFDVKQLSCDFLLCSAYKFYGPHLGILYCRQGLLDQLCTDRLVTQDQRAPFKIETGTLNHAALAGVTAAVSYLASFGEGKTLREKIKDSMLHIASHEFGLYQELYRGLSGLSGIEIIGPPPDPEWHTPTVSFTMDTHTPQQVCQFLASKGICAWDGHFYAQRAIEVLGLSEKGGVTRLGINMYSTREEVDYTLACLNKLLQ